MFRPTTDRLLWAGIGAVIACVVWPRVRSAL